MDSKPFCTHCEAPNPDYIPHSERFTATAYNKQHSGVKTNLKEMEEVEATEVVGGVEVTGVKMVPCEFCAEPVEEDADHAIKGPAPEEAVTGYCHAACWERSSTGL